MLVPVYRRRYFCIAGSGICWYLYNREYSFVLLVAVYKRRWWCFASACMYPGFNPATCIQVLSSGQLGPPGVGGRARFGRAAFGRSFTLLKGCHGNRWDGAWHAHTKTPLLSSIWVQEALQSPWEGEEPSLEIKRNGNRVSLEVCEVRDIIADIQDNAMYQGSQSPSTNLRKQLLLVTLHTLRWRTCYLSHMMLMRGHSIIIGEWWLPALLVTWSILDQVRKC